MLQANYRLYELNPAALNELSPRLVLLSEWYPFIKYKITIIMEYVS
ncbi:hypothetical protein SAMN05660216_02192 [Pseudomonas sp. LAMO17WK12:I8]|nr:hypothetical protein SAMN05660216_02192 [Pseudomonas sp. LAMO17WK12:I8]SNY21869.1 hypothetical protein SAMN05660700_02195 [Pseudomonas sp. LAMO17WK12:I7]SNY23746.1 hypothetical protein SAMN05660344_02515 [Pseudomonas sp. LAMO17WK12:I11]SNY26559.1 hypothetical protein SAMN05660893_02888 [Pseudomonas sp. LAMO17WK12:I12]